MMKSYRLPTVLQQEEEFEKFYDAPGTINDTENQHKEEDVPEHFLNEKEAIFYKEDIEFMRFHKRTSKNVHETL